MPSDNQASCFTDQNNKVPRSTPDFVRPFQNPVSLMRSPLGLLESSQDKHNTLRAEREGWGEAPESPSVITYFQMFTNY
jgi:hypothetical protein